jgi:cytochrome c-type biogenesis protein CcmH/NrfG
MVKIFGKRSAADWCDWGDSYMAKKKYKTAISCYEKAIKLAPNDARAYTGKGQAVIAAGGRIIINEATNTLGFEMPKK